MAFNENRHRRLSSCTPHKSESVVLAGRSSAEPRLPVRPPGARNPGPQELPAGRRSSVAARDTSCCISQYVGWPLQRLVNGYGRKWSVGTGPHVSEHERASLAFHHSGRSGSLRQYQQGVRKKNITEKSDTPGGRPLAVLSTPFPTSAALLLPPPPTYLGLP